MNLFDDSETPHFSGTEKGTGDGTIPFFLPQLIKSEGEEELIGINRKTGLSPSPEPCAADSADWQAYVERVAGQWPEPERSELSSYLLANPGHTVRDWKGKGPSSPCDADPWEKPWSRLRPELVRSTAIAAPARQLPRNIRQAASRDPALIWNPLGKYRLRLPDDPLPGVKSSEADHLGTGGVPRNESKHAILAERARPRVGARGADHEN